MNNNKPVNINLDYSPLNEKINSKQALYEALSELNKMKFNPTSRVLTPLAILYILTVMFIIPMINLINSSIVKAAIYITVFIILVVGVLLALVINHIKYIKLNNFAKLNGTKYFKDRDPGEYYKGLIFKYGHSKKIQEGIKLNGQNPIEIGNYYYETGGGRSKQGHSWGFVKVKLNKKLPHILLDAKKNNMLRYLNNLPTEFSSTQKISLEGDFDRYFTLYAPTSHKTDALYLFTPDVMHTFIEYAGDYDVEIVDDNLYIYSNKKLKLSKPGVIEDLLNMVNLIAKDLMKQSRLYKDHKLLDGDSGVRAEGRRLVHSKKVITALSALTLFMLLFAAIAIIDNRLYVFYIPIAVLVALILSILNASKS